MARQPRAAAAQPSNQWATAVEAIDGLASEVVPDLIGRLKRSGLGELEVRSNGWRVRLRRPVADDAPVADQAAGAKPERATERARRARPEPERVASPEDGGVVTAPAVGYFIDRDGIAPGAGVRGGDTLGWVDVLGVRTEIVAPRDATIDSLEVVAGQAVEYGQPIARLRPAGAAPLSEA